VSTRADIHHLNNIHAIELAVMHLEMAFYMKDIIFNATSQVYRIA